MEEKDMGALQIINSRLDRLAGKRVAPSSAGERESLRAAHASRAKAEGALEAARAAAGRARGLLEAVILDSEALDASELRAAENVADRFREAISTGAAPKFVGDREMEKNAVARAEFDSRRRAAERVVAELAAAEHEREREVTDATAVVERVVQDVLRSEVERITARWAEVELEARAIRVKLGCQGDPAWRLAGDSDAGRRATYQNREDGEFDLRQQQIAADPWISFASGLIRDADARLDFTAADRAIEEMRKESAERQEANDRYLKRVRGEAA
jgi:hypothetical protein